MASDEFIESREIERTSDEKIGRQTFRIYPASTPQAAEADSVLPVIGVDRFPGDSSLIATNERNTRIVDGQNDVWDVTQVFRRGGIVIHDDGDENEQRVIESGGLQTIAKKCYRAGATLTFPIDPSSPSANSDIGGTGKDIEGVPVDRWHRLVRFQFTVKTRSRPNIGMHLSLQNHRNSAPFYGFPKGFVLYEGLVNYNDNGDGSWSLQHSFIADEWLHLEQVPYRQPDGKPYLTVDSAVTLTTIRRASYVVWEQPFPDTGDFSRLGVGSR